MAQSIPDTDPLKREPPGEVSKVPHKEVDRSERPAGKPDEQGGAATGGRPGRQEAEERNATQSDGTLSPQEVATQPVQPGDNSPRRFGISKESRNDQ